jgi:FkbM family methyltransferase
MRNIFFALIFFLSLGPSCDSQLAEPSSPVELPTTDIFTVPDLGTFYLPYKNDMIQKTLRNGEIWEDYNIPVFEAFIRPGKTVVDVGAYIGSHTVKLAQLTKPGIVYAFEPQEDIHQILSHNIELNGLGDYATAYKMALGDRSCNAKMLGNAKKPADLEESTNRGANLLLGCLDDTGDPLAFEMRTLDSFELDNVVFIKIDVEGAELLVLKGAEETIKRNKPVMLIEINPYTGDFSHHRGTSPEEVIQWLEERGYGALEWRRSEYLAIPLP